MTIDTSNVTVTTTAVEGTNLVTRDANGNVVSSTPLPAEVVNANALKDYLAQALPALRTLDAQAKAMSSITLTGSTVAALRANVQGHLRQIGGGLDTVLVGLIKVAQLLSDQLDGTT